LVGYIYKIVNKITNKVCYIGQTKRDLEIRFQEHIFDIDRYQNRKLYKNLKKYGINNFEIKVIETINLNNNNYNILNEKEKYWIEFYDTYNNGLNETVGGEGRDILNLDENKIIKLYNKYNNMSIISEMFNCTPGMIWHILHKNNIIKQYKFQTRTPKIGQYDLDNNLIKIYNNIHEISKELLIKNKSHIYEVCNSKRNTAYGYRWKYQ
jgi:group I intron endonuclease